MITFVTLFLGLFLGVQPVEVRVDEEVAAVELFLDGEPAGRLRGPPWRRALDLGLELKPHLLEAVALDAEGREVARAERWINLPRPPAEVTLFLEEDAEGQRTARLFWESVLGTRPESLRMELDGEPLAGADLSGVKLPELDPETVHFLRAELEFPDNVSTSSELVFGGGFGGAVDTRLTAVPLEIPEKGALTETDLRGWLVKDGEPLQVVALEEGAVDLVVVPDGGALSLLRNLSLEWQSHSSVRTQYRTTQTSLEAELRRTLPLPKDQRLRFLWPFPQMRAGEGGIPFSLFVSTPELTHADGGLVWLLSRAAPPGGLDRSTRLATAVAVAATVAAGRNRRRAVVLLWSGGEGDRSRVAAVTVRRYLEHLRVPFRVWSLVKDGTAPGWGETEDASTLLKLERAYKRLVRDLERQRIAWVAGTHLPQSIEVVDGGPDLRLARTPVPANEPVVAPPERLRQADLDRSPEPKAAERESRSPTLAELPDLVQQVVPEVRGPSASGPDRPRERIPVDEGVRLRAAPDAAAPHLAVVDAGIDLEVTNRRGSWARVTYDGRSGWVRVSPDGRAHPGEVEPLPSAPPPTEATSASSADRRADRRARARQLLASPSGSLGPYDLLTDVEDPDLLAALDRLAGSIDDLFEKRFGLVPAPVEPGEAVLLFADEATYRRYADTEDDDLASRGLAAHAGGGVAALYVGDRDWPVVAALLAHELTHLVTHRTLGSILPPWLEEGLADDLAFCRIEKDGRLSLGTLGGATASRVRRRSLGRGTVRVEQEREISGARASLLRLAGLAETRELPALRELVSLSQRELVVSEHRALWYPLSVFFVRFLLDRERSAEVFRDFLAGAVVAEDLAGDRLVALLDTDWPRLQRSFGTWLRSEVRRLGPVRGTG